MSNAAIVPKLLSGSTGGKGIKIAATASPGTLIHATGIAAADMDEITLRAVNSDTVVRQLILEVGGVGNPEDRINVDVPPLGNGEILVMMRRRLSGTGAAAREVRAFCATTNVLVVNGEVDTITP